MILPPFNNDGLLPSGDYPLTLAALRASFLVTGAGVPGETWDAVWRLSLVNGLETMVRQLWVAGITEIFINGSFVENKDHPNDIDGYFVCELDALRSGELQRELNRQDPWKVWTWDPASRRPYSGYPKKQLPMWHRYRVEFYPHVGQLSGIRDKHGNELEFPSAFRQARRDGAQKGIVQIIRDRGDKP